MPGERVRGHPGELEPDPGRDLDAFLLMFCRGDRGKARVLQAVYIEGLSYRQAARSLGVPKSNVARLARQFAAVLVIVAGGE